jgi:diadenosine tetraphosphate (Ap4A) HIT family hydrolase
MLIFETDHWLLKHRADTTLPGYLILVAKNSHTTSLSGLSAYALSELGYLQAQATRFLEVLFDAKLVYICKWGHQQGNQPHFHIVPLYDWVKSAYFTNPLWFKYEPNPDGPVYFTYITRAFIEYEVSPTIKGPTIDEVIQVLRKEFALQYHIDNCS